MKETLQVVRRLVFSRLGAAFIAAFVAALVVICVEYAMTRRAPAENICLSAGVAQVRPQPGAVSANAVPSHIVEQYKAYVGDLGTVGNQRASTQTFYVSVISALIAVLALKETGRPSREILTGVPIGVLLAIAAISFNWFLTELRFNDLFLAKFIVICDMERSYYALLFPMFAEQSQLYLGSGAGGIIRSEEWVIGLGAAAAVSLAAFGIAWQLGGPKVETPDDDPELLGFIWRKPKKSGD